MTKEEREELKAMLLALIPEDGGSIGNKTLRQKFTKKGKKIVSDITEEDYWDIRNDLLDDGEIAKGRGRGGSVFRLIEDEDESVETATDEVKSESDLYEPFYKTLQDYWVKEKDLREYVVQQTHSQGRRKTGGTWTRPDMAIVSVGKYTYVPGKILEVTTFEIKPRGSLSIVGVFETAAHAAFAHRSYLALNLSDSHQESVDFERIKNECRRLEVGLLVFDDPKDWETWEIVSEGQRRDPDPAAVNDFITKQIGEDSRTRILEMLK